MHSRVKVALHGIGWLSREETKPGSLERLQQLQQLRVAGRPLPRRGPRRAELRAGDACAKSKRVGNKRGRLRKRG